MRTKEYVEKARVLLHSVRGRDLDVETRAERAIELAKILVDATNHRRRVEGQRLQGQLAGLLTEENAGVWAVELVDRALRPRSRWGIADQLVHVLRKYDVPKFLPLHHRIAIHIVRLLGRPFVWLAAPMVLEWFRHQANEVIVDATPHALEEFITKWRRKGCRVNLNRIGEAVLGEEEATARLHQYLEDLDHPKIDCISIKITSIYSQVSSIGREETLQRIKGRLRTLYRRAGKKMVHLDMEAFEDLDLTVTAFCEVLEEEEFLQTGAGIALQAYLPESYQVLQQLTEWAKERTERGGQPIRVRLVKGANLEMERVISALHNWPQAPFSSKHEVDIQFKRMLEWATRPEHASFVHVGVGSHNLFDVAYAFLLRAERKVEPFVEFEMLEGMAAGSVEVVLRLAGGLLLYSPVAGKKEFLYAMAYLIRRFDENSGPENFLHSYHSMTSNSEPFTEQAERFRVACLETESFTETPRRGRAPMGDDSAYFRNAPDVDWAVEKNRIWLAKILQTSPSKHQSRTTSQGELERIIERASGEVSLECLHKVAGVLEKRRGELIREMAFTCSKTVYEADIEVSEAIDFVRYYVLQRSEIEALRQQGLESEPLGPVLVASPWNFPCSIPVGQISGALATGNPVLFKPAPEAVAVGWKLINCFWEAGVSEETLQFVECRDTPEGDWLVKNPHIRGVLLTGGTETAKHMLALRPDLPLFAETGGKNSLIVTDVADRDLVIQDVLYSAFAQSGQKCSACSLLICLPPVYSDRQFLAQLKDAAKSLKVGLATDPATAIPPCIQEPKDPLLRGLTTLERGERWLLRPVRSAKNPALWSPGIKMGVQRGSFSHQTELFGPVLSVMEAQDLEEAIQIANSTPYGLTAGLHSLDEREQTLFLEKIRTGNVYINRPITGAIVQRQPFGGYKQSSFGPGIKAGGPNYLFQFMRQKSVKAPEDKKSSVSFALAEEAAERLSEEEFTIWKASISDYRKCCETHFSPQDPTKLLGEDNLLRYLPRAIYVRIASEDSALDILRMQAAALITGAHLVFSAASSHQGDDTIVVEEEEAFLQRIKKAEDPYVRTLHPPSSSFHQMLAVAGVRVIVAPVLAHGRVELLHYLREQAISIRYHRYGNLGRRRHEVRANLSLPDDADSDYARLSHPP